MKRMTMVLLWVAVLALTGTTAQAQNIRSQAMKQLRAQAAWQRESTVLPRQMKINSFGLTQLPTAFTPGFGSHRAPLVAADGTVLVGNMNYASYWTTRQNSLYTFTATEGTALFENITGGYQFSANGGGTFSPDKLTYHLIEYVQTTAGELNLLYAEIDTRTWSISRMQELSDASLIAFDLARDPQTGRVYGAFINSARTGYELGVIDYNTLTRSTIGSLSKVVVGLAANASGQLYAIATDGNLYRVNKQTAALTLVGSLGISVPEYQQSATFNTEKNTLYWTRFEQGQSGLYEVDPATGQAQPISTFASNEQIIALEVYQAAVDPEAPARPENFSVTFHAEQKTADVSFFVPALTADGGELIGQVTAHILVNGLQAATRELPVGQQATLTISLPTDGSNSVAVYLSNAAGNGEPTEAIVGFVGEDLPATSRLSATLAIAAQGQATLTWDTPTEGQHGGYVDRQKLAYVVSRHTEDGTATVVADSRNAALTPGTFSEQLPTAAMHLYYYTVDILYADQHVATLTTNRVRFGQAFEVPYANHFDSADEFLLFETHDLNADGVTWEWHDMLRCASIGWSEGGHNDLLVSPPVALRAGNYYRLSYTIRGLNSQYTEKYKAAWGPADADPESYAHVIEPETEFSNYRARTVEQVLAIDEDQTVRVALTALSAARAGRIYVDDFSVELLSAFNAPAAPTITATAADMGALEATVSMVAPTLQANGQPLNSLTSVSLTRGDDLLTTFSDVQPGQQLHYNDPQAQQGYNTYRAVATNEAGNSVAAEVTVYVGIDVPEAPANITLSEQADGIHLSWTAPGNVGARGGYVDNSRLAYNIGRIGDTDPVAVGLTDTHYLDATPFTGDQRLLYYGVQAQSEAGTGNWGMSDYLVVGDSYELPFAESFPGQSTTYPMWLINDNDAIVESSLSQDGDGGAIVIQSATTEQVVLTSGKINLSKAESPVLSFYYALLPSQSKLRVRLLKNGTDPIDLTTIDFSTVTASGQTTAWSDMVTLPLADYRDSRYVQLQFIVDNDRQGVVAFDNVRIDDKHRLNAALTLLQVPTRVAAGESFTATVSLTNLGYETLAAQPLELYVDGHLVATRQAPRLASEARAQIDFSIQATAAMRQQAEVRVVAPLEGDANPADNELSATLGVTTLALPTVTDLTGQLDPARSGTVSLSWSRPDYTEPVSLTDDVEGYELWSIDAFGQWTAYNDNASWPSAPLDNATFPHMGETFTAIVFDPSIVDAGKAHSGNQCWAIFDNDGWAGDYGSGCELTRKYLISPELTGEAQTITFYVANAMQYQPESFDVLYSTATDSHADFTHTAYTTGVSGLGYDTDWHEISIDLPAGARYFAIRCTSEFSTALLIDDVTYAPKQASQAPMALPAANRIEGYNVYCDSVRVNTELVTDTHFATAYDRPDSHYQVSAVYTRGEAALSNVFDLSVVGIGSMPAGTPLSLEAGRGQLVVAQAEGQLVSIFNAAGQRVASQTAASPRQVFALQRGTYVVSVGRHQAKVVVK